MAYTKQTWTNGDVITAEKLNHIEDGISGSGGSNALICEYDNDAGHTDKTFGEIKDALLSGKTVLFKTEEDSESGTYNMGNFYVYRILGSEDSYYCEVEFRQGLLISSVYSTIEELDNAYLNYAD